EISLDTYQAAQLLTWAEFAAKATVPPAAGQTFDMEVFKARKQNKRDDAKAQWLKDMAVLSGAHEGADRAAIAAAFDKQHKLSGEAVEGAFPQLALPMAGQRKLVLLDGQKMTRKTSVALRSVVSQAIAQGLSGVIYCPTNVLARAMASEFKTLGVLTIAQWLAKVEEGEDLPKPLWLVGCPESAHRTADLSPDIVLIDEANESLPRIQSGQLGVKPAECRRTIKAQLAAARMVVLAQDGLYRPTVRAVQRWGNFDPSEIEILRRRRPATNMTINLHVQGSSDHRTSWDGLPRDEDQPKGNAAFYTWFDGLAEAQRAGKTVIVPSGAEGKLRQIDRVLKAEFPDISSQVIDGRWSPGNVRSQFADAPTEFAPRRGLRRLGYSPTFDSGVSIEDTYFDAQYEYIRAFEPASSASQRGERYRDAIRGQKLTERNVYVSSHGLPSLPPVEVFTPEYWRQYLSSPDNTDALALAQQMGCKDLADKLDQDNPDDWAELPECLAIQARETFFKVELLTQEWEGNGWAIVHIESDPDSPQQWSYAFYEVSQGLIEQHSRILAKAKPQQIDEVKGAIAANKNHKWQLAEQIGDLYPGLKDSEWLAAWVVASGERSLDKLQVRSLVQMAHEQPQLWAELSRQFALATLATRTDINPPSLPCSARAFEIAKLLKDTPGLYQVIVGEVQTWTNRDAIPQQAAAWAKQNAKGLARFTQHNQRIHGLQFTPKTGVLDCLHKLLSMVGLEGHYMGRQSTGDRLREYRLKAVGDIEAKLQAELDKDQPRPHDLQRHQLRLNTDSEVYQTLDSVLSGKVRRNAPEWAGVAEELIAQYGPSTGSVGIDPITELVDVSPGRAVKKRGVRGWQGPIVAIERDQWAWVLWGGDKDPSLVPLSELELWEVGIAA
ncbi:MAG: hypothetical protein DCF17_21815, partial [Shackletoniella antarctica]